MKTILFAGLTTLALAGAIVPTANAAPATAFNPYTAQSSATQLSPSDLVGLANHGYLRDQGIPSSGALVAQYQLGNITAKDLVDSAVKANRLPAQVAQDANYLRSVDNQLQVIANIR